jgi:putative spermidine/putrescine transport system substrate-binding protein
VSATCPGTSHRLEHRARAGEPTSWSAFWDIEWQKELALLRNAANSYLLEITATLFFDAYDILDTEDGIVEV